MSVRENCRGVATPWASMPSKVPAVIALSVGVDLLPSTEAPANTKNYKTDVKNFWLQIHIHDTDLGP